MSDTFGAQGLEACGPVVLWFFVWMVVAHMAIGHEADVPWRWSG